MALALVLGFAVPVCLIGLGIGWLHWPLRPHDCRAVPSSARPPQEERCRLMDVSPVIVTAPDGTEYAPVRAVVLVDASTEGASEIHLDLLDRDGVTLVSVSVTGGLSQGRKRSTVHTDAGDWLVQELCGCNGRFRALRREWLGTPPRVGT